MHTMIRLIISVAVLLLLIIGCSRSNQSNMPVTGEMPAISGGEIGDKGSLEEVAYPERFGAATYDIHENDPCTTAQTHFSPEGVGTYYTTLLDCIAGTYYEYSGTYYNYILACDTQYKWSGSWQNYPRVRLYKLSSADSPSATNLSYLPGTYFWDPDGCDLVNVESYLYAFVADSGTNYVRLYYWTLNTSGNISTGPSYARLFSHDDMNNCQGVAATITYDTSHYHLLVCDPSDRRLFVFDQDGNTIGFSGGYDYYQFPSGEKPIDVCVARYPNGEWSYWIAYVAVRNSSDGNNDCIRCFKWDGSDYDLNSNANCTGSGPDYFPNIMSLSVLKCGVSASSEHNDGTVCVLMYDTDDFRGYYLRQIDFGSSDSAYDDFTDDFDSVTSTIDGEQIDAGISESLAMCKQYYSSGGNTYIGYHYCVNDRDPDLNGTETAPYNGDNILLYNNNQP